jgi:hypothetical protein
MAKVVTPGFGIVRTLVEVRWLPGFLRDHLERLAAYEVVARTFDPSLPPIRLVQFIGLRRLPHLATDVQEPSPNVKPLASDRAQPLNRLG